MLSTEIGVTPGQASPSVVPLPLKKEKGVDWYEAAQMEGYESEKKMAVETVGS